MQVIPYLRAPTECNVIIPEDEKQASQTFTLKLSFNLSVVYRLATLCTHVLPQEGNA